MISDTDLVAYIRPSTDDDLPTLRRLERAATAMIEKRTGRSFGVAGPRTEVLQWRGWPLQVSNSPSGAITSLEYWDGSAWTVQSTDSYHVDGSFIYLERGRFMYSPVYGSPLLAPNRFRVTYNTGYTDEGGDEWDAPEDIKQAVLLLVGHWFENREAVVVGTNSSGELPLAVSALIDGHTRTTV